jgi:hypothetical protein
MAYQAGRMPRGASTAFEHERDVEHAEILGISPDLKSQFPAHFQHDGVFPEDLAIDAAQAFGLGVFDDQLHQGPAQAPALEIRSQQDRVLADFADRVEMKPDDAEHLTSGFIDRDKGHRARMIEFRQAGDELIRKFPDGIKKAKPQVFFADMREKGTKQRFIVRSDRTDKYPPAIPENQVALPSGIDRWNI